MIARGIHRLVRLRLRLLRLFACDDGLGDAIERAVEDCEHACIEVRLRVRLLCVERDELGLRSRLRGLRVDVVERDLVVDVCTLGPWP